MDWASLTMKGFALLGMLSFTWAVGRYGLMPLLHKVGSAFNVAKADFVALEARVTGIEKTLLGPTIKVPPVPPAAA